MSDLLMVKDVSTAGIDKNNKMVIRPLGAMYKTGLGEISLV